MKQLSQLVLTLFILSTVAQADIKEDLQTIEGLTVVSEIAHPQYRIFELSYLQPEDHKNPESPKFPQRLVLWHKDAARPMVLQTSGYAIFSRGISALAMEFNANQVQVEHRFFKESIPANPNWALDNIEQSANDFHRITVALKSIYKAKWVNTGRSKGGMTSVYHRRFFPNDLDATVAHVAPHSFSLEDGRYADFVADEIGGEANAECRADLLNSQKVLLSDEVKQMILKDRLEGNFELLGSEEIALEHAIIEMPWSYWQYAGPGADCSNVPKADSPAEDHIGFLYTMNDPTGYADEPLSDFVPYYFQAATQLGNPGTRLLELNDLLKFEETFKIGTYVPKNIPAVYDEAAAMRDVSDWLRNESERILFVYGGWDPWTAGAYEDVRAEGDNHLFIADKVNHSAQFIDLKGETHAFVYDKLRSWLDIDAEEAPTPLGQRAGDKAPAVMRLKTLEYKEFEKLRGRKL